MNTYNKNLLVILALFLTTATSLAQNSDSKFAGTYQGSDKLNTLILNADGTFFYKQLVMSLDSFNTKQIEDRTGNWISEENTIILNPEKSKRKMAVEINETADSSQDFITIQLNYIQNSFENDSIKNEKMDMPFWTIYINDEKNPISIIKNKNFESLTPLENKKIYFDESNTFKIPRKGFKKIGIDTSNFEEIYWYKPSDVLKNSFAFEFNVPNAQENSIRNNKCIIKNGKIYQILKGGKIDKKVNEIPLSKIN